MSQHIVPFGEVVVEPQDTAAAQVVRELYRAYPDRRFMVTVVDEEVRWPWRRCRQRRVRVYELAGAHPLHLQPET